MKTFFYTEKTPPTLYFGTAGPSFLQYFLSLNVPGFPPTSLATPSQFPLLIVHPSVYFADCSSLIPQMSIHRGVIHSLALSFHPLCGLNVIHMLMLPKFYLQLQPLA